MALLTKHEGLITAEEFLHWPDVGRCELVNGKIVHLTASRPLHALVEVRLGGRLLIYGEASGRGQPLGGEVGLWVRRGPDTVRGADLAFISHERWARRNPKSFLDVPPELVVEILSPDDRRGEAMEKLEEYLAMGVDLVWIVDPEFRCVLAYRGSLFEVERFEEGDVLMDEEILPGFSLPVAYLFRE
jgi:Uma2 family endonuclease